MSCTPVSPLPNNKTPLASSCTHAACQPMLVSVLACTALSHDLSEYSNSLSTVLDQPYSLLLLNRDCMAVPSV
jgi:hypothetical protein